MSSFSRISAALLVAGGLVVTAVPMADAAPADCQYSSAKKAVTLTIASTTSDQISILRKSGSKLIGYHVGGGAWTACGTASTTNTDKIKVIGSTLSDTVWIDLTNGTFAPGATKESSGTSEIEFTVDLGDGTDTLTVYGTAGNDSFSYASSSQGSLNADSDVDMTMKNVDRWWLYGNDGNDVLDGRGVPKLVVYGGSGADSLTGGPGSDSLYGDNGADDLRGGASDDSVNGGEGDDTLAGDAGDDYLYGMGGRDHVDGGADDDYIDGGSSNDGADYFDGGVGADTIDYYQRSLPIKASIDGHANDGADQEGDNITSTMENVYGGSAADVITGSKGNNTLVGYGDSDMISGLAGDDTLNGSDGNDSLKAGVGDDYLPSEAGDDVAEGGDGDDYFYAGPVADGADTLSGGAGYDQLDYSGRSADLVLDLESVGGDGDSAASENDDLAADFETIDGGSGSDQISGGAGDEYIWAGPSTGADIVDGRGGSDRLYGVDGNDLLVGGEGYDYMYGGNGDDSLYAVDQGEDYLDCGPGAGDVVTTIDAVDTYANCETVP